MKPKPPETKIFVWLEIEDTSRNFWPVTLFVTFVTTHSQTLDDLPTVLDQSMQRIEIQPVWRLLIIRPTRH